MRNAIASESFVAEFIRLRLATMSLPHSAFPPEFFLVERSRGETSTGARMIPIQVRRLNQSSPVRVMIKAW